MVIVHWYELKRGWNGEETVIEMKIMSGMSSAIWGGREGGCKESQGRRVKCQARGETSTSEEYNI